VNKKVYDLAVKVSEYQDKQTGAKKARWQTIGAMMSNDEGGHFVLINRWFSPAGVQDLSGKGGESVLVSCFRPQEDGGRGGVAEAHDRAKRDGYQGQRAAARELGKDDIPF
jgi:hypothetical protein